MFNFYRISCASAKQSFHNQTWRLLNSAETNFRRNDKIAKLSSSTAAVCNRCTESVVPLNRSIFSLYSEKRNFITSRNFSVSNTLLLWKQSNQDSEKVKNYIFFGVVLVLVIFVMYMFQTMEYHQDYVHFEPSEKKK